MNPLAIRPGSHVTRGAVYTGECRLVTPVQTVPRRGVAWRAWFGRHNLDRGEFRGRKSGNGESAPDFALIWPPKTLNVVDRF